MNSFRKRFGELLRDARQAQQIPQTELARILKVDQSALSRIETGQQRIPIDLAWRAMRRLGIKPDSLRDLSRGES